MCPPRGANFMMRRSIFVLCFVTLISGYAAAQTKTVTNADLEKFRQKREAGERSLKAYYAKKGLTEAEVAKQQAADAKASEELSARLRSERLELEWLAHERAEREAAPPQVNVYVPPQERNNTQYYVYENPYYPYFPRRAPRNWGNRSNERWRATPGGMIYEGRAPAQIPTQPNWRRRRW